MRTRREDSLPKQRPKCFLPLSNTKFLEIGRKNGLDIFWIDRIDEFLDSLIPQLLYSNSRAYLAHHLSRPCQSVTKVPLSSDIHEPLLFRCFYLSLVQVVADEALSLRNLDFWFAAMLLLEPGHPNRIHDLLKNIRKYDNGTRDGIN
jgi:hypothetical protein